MDDYISKPILIDSMRKLIGQWIDLDGAPTDASAPPPARGEAPVEIGGGTVGMILELAPCIDLAQMRSFTDGDEALEKDLVRLFAVQSEANIAALAANRKDGVATEWVAAAHMLKGGAASIGAEALRRLCDAAQAMEGAESAEREAAYRDIETAYTHVKHALKCQGFLK
jgi:HPt (histidine-containing phosphotransfer) domain-containing protein